MQDLVPANVRVSLALHLLQVVGTFVAGFPSSGENDSPSVEAVGFSPSLPVAVTGSLSGVLGVWDLPTQKLRQQCQHGVGHSYASRSA